MAEEKPAEMKEEVPEVSFCTILFISFLVLKRKILRVSHIG